jgi:hypothetical protein
MTLKQYHLFMYIDAPIRRFGGCYYCLYVAIYISEYIDSISAQTSLKYKTTTFSQ